MADETDVAPYSVEWINQRYRDARNSSSGWRSEARTAYDFVAGHQWDAEDVSALKEALRPVITFNRIDPIISAVAGAEVQNRQEIRVLPREIGDTQVSEVMTGAMKWVQDECDAPDEESDAFFDLIVTGMGWVETRMDYETDLDGQIVMRRVDPLEMFWDPAASRRNLSDGRWLARVRDMPDAEVKALWPEQWAELGGGPSPWDDALDDTAPKSVDPRTAYDGDDTSAIDETVNKGTKRIIECQWVERSYTHRVVNPSTGQIENLNDKQWKALQQATKASGIAVGDLPHVRVPQAVYKRAFICGSVELERGDVPGGAGFTYRAMTGKRDRNKRSWYGLVRGMLDPQRWGNKFFSQFMSIVNSNAQGGAIAEKDALDNPRKAMQDWTKPNSLIFVKQGRMGGIGPKPMAPFPAGVDRMLEFAIGSIRETSGLNLETLGQASAVQPGVLEYQRRQAGLTVLATLFDSLRRYRKEQGRVLVAFVTEFISDGRLIRILGADGVERYVPLTKQPGTAKYDLVVDSAPSSPNEKERVFQILMALMPTLAQIGALPPPDVLDYTPLPSSLVAKWKEQIQQQQAAAKTQPNPAEQAAQVEMAKAQAQVQAQRAKAEADAALKREQAQLEAQLSIQKAQIDAEAQRQKAALDLQISRERMAAEMALEREKIDGQMELRRYQIDQEMALESARLTMQATMGQQTTEIRTGGEPG